MGWRSSLITLGQNQIDGPLTITMDQLRADPTMFQEVMKSSEREGGMVAMKDEMDLLKRT